jgi:hypothetical protein
MAKKESFILYQNYYEILKSLADEQLGILLRAIFIYNETGEVITLATDVRIAFEFIKSQLDRDNKRYEEVIKKRAEAGKIGMQRRWEKEEKNSKKTKKNIDNEEKNNKNNKCYQDITNDNKRYQSITNITDNVYDDVNDNVDDNDKRLKDKRHSRPKSAGQEIEIEELFPEEIKEKKLLPQQQAVEIFSRKYENLTKMRYVARKADFIEIADLLKHTDEKELLLKIDILERLCKEAAVSSKKPVWFVDGLSSFSIGVLVKNYNALTPYLTAEEKKNLAREKVLEKI